MTPLFDHHTNHYLLPELFEKDSNQWAFAKNLKSADIELFRQVLTHLPITELSFDVLCQQLRRDLILHPSDEDNKNKLMTALMIAELLEEIYAHYLVVKPKAFEYKKKQKVLKRMLHDRGVTFEKSMGKMPQKPKPAFSGFLRDGTGTTNFPRLMMVRLKRILDTISALFRTTNGYSKAIASLDKWANPPIAWLAWVFYCPRLIDNALMTAKHGIPGWWMSEQEKALGWQIRLRAQWQRRWFELANDAVWLAVGFINCFILTGVVLAPFAIYLTVALFTFDLLLAGIQAVQELLRLRRFKKELMALDIDPILKHDFNRHYQERLHYEQMRLALNVVATASLFLAMCLALPLLCVHPAVPVIGAVLIVGIFASVFILRKWLEHSKPKTSISYVAFHQKEEPENDDAIEPLPDFQKKLQQESRIPHSFSMNNLPDLEKTRDFQVLPVTAAKSSVARQGIFGDSIRHSGSDIMPSPSKKHHTL